ncbi:MAG: hypothetical protein JNM01_12735 [Delftia acidovorans]|nr:hypothetical protein [Delftia acidovorans]
MTATKIQPVAEICSASHDDAQFGERAIKPLCDISSFDYGTPLYAGAAPAAVAGRTTPRNDDERAAAQFFADNPGAALLAWPLYLARDKSLALEAPAAPVGSARQFIEWMYSQPEDREPTTAEGALLEFEAHLAAAAPQAPAAPVHSKTYSDGTVATGSGELPAQSPQQQVLCTLLDTVEAMLGGANGPTIQIRAALLAAPAAPVVNPSVTWTSADDGLPEHGDLVLCDFGPDYEGGGIQFGYEVLTWDEHHTVAGVARWLKLDRMPESLADHTEIDRLMAAPAVPEDPMDWPLPCDVTVGHGTIRKGCKLRTLVLRMQVLYDLSQKVELAAPAAPAVDADPLGLRDVGEAFMQAIERNSDALKAVGWLGPMDCPSEIVGDLLNLLEEANTTSALGEWVATLEVDSGGGLDYETVPPCTLPPGCYPLYRAAQAAAKGEHGHG